MTNFVSYEFDVTDAAPKSTRKGGGPGRTRSNQFDKPLRDSFEQKFYVPSNEHPEGRFWTFTVDADERVKVIGQIRNAQQWLREHGDLDIGSEVRHGPEKDADGNETGRTVIAFRGKPLETRNRAPEHSAGNEAAGSNDADRVDAVNEEDEYYDG